MSINTLSWVFSALSSSLIIRAPFWNHQECNSAIISDSHGNEMYNSSNLIHMIKCAFCVIQCIGNTKKSFRHQFSNRRYGINSKRTIGVARMLPIAVLYRRWQNYSSIAMSEISINITNNIIKSYSPYVVFLKGPSDKESTLRQAMA